MMRIIMCDVHNNLPYLYMYLTIEFKLVYTNIITLSKQPIDHAM